MSFLHYVYEPNKNKFFKRYISIFFFEIEDQILQISTIPSKKSNLIIEIKFQMNTLKKNRYFTEFKKKGSVDFFILFLRIWTSLDTFRNLGNILLND